MATVGILEERYESHEIERAVIEAAGHRVLDIPPEREDWPDWMKSADAILVNLTPITERELESLPACRALCRYGAGFDAIDVRAAAKRGIAVINQPAVTVEEVSDHTIALWLACMRQILPRDAAVRRGEWNTPTPAATRRLHGTVFGIVGFGLIGRAVARKVSPFEPEEILVYDPYVDDEVIRGLGCVPATLDDLLSRSSTVSLHTALNDETRNMINAESLARMKRGTCLLNTSRGGLMDMDAVADALESGQLHSAGLDVFPAEPPGDLRVFRLPTAVVTDHCAWYSVQSQVDLQRTTAESAVRFLAGDEDLSVVNRDLM